MARKLLRENLECMMEIMGADSRTTELNFDQLLRDSITLNSFMVIFCVFPVYNIVLMRKMCRSINSIKGSNDYLAGYVASEAFKVFAAEYKNNL